MLSPTFLYVLILAYFGSVEWGPIFTGYLGLLLLGSAFMAMGILFSSLTENQIVAAVLSFGALIIFWVLGWAADYTGATAAAVLGHLSVLEHVESFSKGVLDLKDTIYYLSFVGFSLFLTVRSLESWKWRG
jgi:ABC-2 type transport system permease protein